MPSTSTSRTAVFVADEVVEVEAAGGDFGQVHHLVSGANQEKAWTTGDIEAGMVTVGMCGGLINDIPSCEERQEHCNRC